MTDRNRRSLLSVTAVALAAVFAHVARADETPTDPYDGYRSRASIVLPATIRDFQPVGTPGGHPDFSNMAPGGNGRYGKLAADTLSPSDLKPVLFSTGYKILSDWRDSAGRCIIPTRSYIDAMPGDFAGSMSGSVGGACTSAATFAQWFRDVPGVNTPYPRQFNMAYDSSSMSYVFDGTLDDWRGGGLNDFYYTADTSIEFVYERGRGWFVSAGTSGDAFAFIDDKQVLDLGSGVAVSYGVAGVVANGSITLNTSAHVDPAVAGGPVNVTTMSTAISAVTLYDSARVTGNVAIGPGGNPATGIMMNGSAQITGTRTALPAPMALPPLPAIPNVGPSVGDRIYASDVTISSDLHCNNLTLNGSTKMFISGNRRIVCDATFAATSSSQLQIMANSSLTLYCRGFNTQLSTRLNQNTANPLLFTIYLYGTGPFTSSSSAGVYANVIAPSATLSIGGSARWYGNAYTNAVNLGASALFTVVQTGPWGTPSGAAGPGMSAMQRIDLDRLAWLTADRTHHLRLFFANRTGQASRLRVETNINLLRLAAVPSTDQRD